ncbi:hypothetical protein B484DRAFT_58966 [Ochromonadaceae sp. CCMP2298]|nr:hypothetical protein B484DRAFT_58966 [Ochromonadaceae sp. CCMP2298]
MRFFLFWGGGGGGGGEETLDRPLSNFDVIGIPTGAWSSSLFGCLEHVPSCVVGFSCPCVLWAQVVVRAQLPLLIGLKNSLECMRMNSGYGAFVDYFFFSIVLTGVLLVVLLLVTLPSIVVVLFALMLVVLLGSLLFLVSHSRTAFREKYSLPGVLPQGCGFWEMLWDALIVGACLPCALSQMARHVFQYPRMDTQLGLFLSDPSALPPLRRAWPGQITATWQTSPHRQAGHTGSRRRRRGRGSRSAARGLCLRLPLRR